MYQIRAEGGVEEIVFLWSVVANTSDSVDSLKSSALNIYLHYLQELGGSLTQLGFVPM